MDHGSLIYLFSPLSGWFQNKKVVSHISHISKLPLQNDEENMDQTTSTSGEPIELISNTNILIDIDICWYGGIYFCTYLKVKKFHISAVSNSCLFFLCRIFLFRLIYIQLIFNVQSPPFPLYLPVTIISTGFDLL